MTRFVDVLETVRDDYKTLFTSELTTILDKLDVRLTEDKCMCDQHLTGKAIIMQLKLVNGLDYKFIMRIRCVRVVEIPKKCRAVSLQEQGWTPLI